MNKLQKVERSLNIYSNETKDEIKEIILDIPLERLRNIMTVKDGDFLLYRDYMLNAEQLEKISDELKEKINPDFALYYYVLECHGIYNWS